MNLTRFFRALYSCKPKDDYILVWEPTGTGGKSFWYTSIEKAVRKISKSKDRNIYFQVGLSGRAHGMNRRCSSIEAEGRPVVTMPALFCDIDIKDSVHKHKNLPTTEEEALSIIKGFGYDPSIIIHSGHGLQAYWIFKEPWELSTEKERLACSRLLLKLKFTLKDNARKMGVIAGESEGWHIDSVQEICRILRPPGSRNWKDPIHIKKVVVIEETPIRYNPEDLDELLIDMTLDELNNFIPTVNTKIPQVRVVVKEPNRDNDGKIIPPQNLAHLTDEDIKNQPKIEPQSDGTIILDVNANPPFDKFQALVGMDTTFAITWMGKNPSLVDRSQSSYDMSLSHQAVKMEWNDQEIANLIIANRRLHQNDLKKALRKDYILGTILKCRNFQEKKSATVTLEAASEISGTKYQDVLTRGEIKKGIKAKHGIEIIDIIKFLSDISTYEIYTTKGTIKLKSTEELIRPTKLQARVAEYTKQFMPFDKGKWPDTARQLLLLCRDERISDDDTINGRVTHGIIDYLEDASPNMTKEKSIQGKMPFIENNHWHLNFDKFFMWMKIYRGEEERKTEVRKMMMKLKCLKKRYNIDKAHQGKTSRSTLRVLQIPNRILTDALARKGFKHNPDELEQELMDGTIH